MTGSEWLEFYNQSWSNQIALFTVAITFSSAYIAVAYVAGAKLTKTQVALINCIFVPTMLILIFAIFAAGVNMEIAVFEGFSLVPELSHMAANSNGISLFIITLSTLVNFGILFVCIKFMRDVRKNSNT